MTTENTELVKPVENTPFALYMLENGQVAVIMGKNRIATYTNEEGARQEIANGTWQLIIGAIATVVEQILKEANEPKAGTVHEAAAKLEGATKGEQQNG